MTLTELLKQKAEHSYIMAETLFRMVQPKDLGWKPTSGRNWMTVGQLMMHCTQACGTAIKGFVTGDFGLPEGVSFEDLPPEQALPPAEAMPAVASVEQPLALLAEDRALAACYLDEAGETALLTRTLAAPGAGLR